MPLSPSCVQTILDACVVTQVAPVSASVSPGDPHPHLVQGSTTIDESLQRCVRHHSRHASCTGWASEHLRNSTASRPRVAAVLTYSLLSRLRQGTDDATRYSCGAALAWVALHTARFANAKRHDFDIVVVHDGTQPESELAALRRLGARTHVIGEGQLQALCLSQTFSTEGTVRRQSWAPELCRSEHMPTSARFVATPNQTDYYHTAVTAELYLVEAWRFIEYDAVVFFDTDVYVKHEPMHLERLEDSIAFMLRAPSPFSQIFTHEPPCTHRGHACAQGGFFLLRPNVTSYLRLFSGILSGYHGWSRGWDGVGNVSIRYADLGHHPPGLANFAHQPRVQQWLSNSANMTPWSFWGADTDQGLLTWAFAVQSVESIWTANPTYIYHFNSGCCQPQRLYGPRDGWCHEARHAMLNTTHRHDDDTREVRSERTAQMGDRARRAYEGLSRAIVTVTPGERAEVPTMREEVDGLLRACAAEMLARLNCSMPAASAPLV